MLLGGILKKDQTISSGKRHLWNFHRKEFNELFANPELAKDLPDNSEDLPPDEKDVKDSDQVETNPLDISNSAEEETKAMTEDVTMTNQTEKPLVSRKAVLEHFDVESVANSEWFNKVLTCRLCSKEFKAGAVKASQSQPPEVVLALKHLKGTHRDAYRKCLNLEAAPDHPPKPPAPVSLTRQAYFLCKIAKHPLTFRDQELCNPRRLFSLVQII